MIREKVQIDIANKIAKEKEGLIIASVRAGKTRACILGLKKLNPKSILWVTVSEKLRDIDIPDEFIKWDAEDLLKNTKIICYQSLNKELGKYDYIILDEFQSITYNNMENIMTKTLKGKIIGLTGTFPRNKEKKEILKYLDLNIIYNLSVDDAAKLGIVADYEIIVLNFELDDKKSVNKTKNKKLVTDKVRYKHLSWAIENNKLRNKENKWLYMSRARFLYDCRSRKVAWEYVKDNYLNDKRGLIFYPFIKDAEKERSFYHSQSSDKGYLDFKDKIQNTLGLVKSGGIGHTYHDLDYVFITQATSDNTGITSQMIGRSLLFRPNYTAKILILCAIGTQDEIWVDKTLSRFDKSKVRYFDLKI